jgi:hypothetical protein
MALDRFYDDMDRGTGTKRDPGAAELAEEGVGA